jgi:transposase-like protein
MLAKRGIDVSYERVRRWALKFGAMPLEVSSRSDAL